MASGRATPSSRNLQLIEGRFPKANLAGLTKFVFFPTDTRLIPDEHYFHTDIVANHYLMLLSIIILKQFVEMLHTSDCSWLADG